MDYGDRIQELADRGLPIDAYGYCGSLHHDHPAVVVGLTGSTTDDEIDHLTARMLMAFGEPPFDTMTLGPALVTWRDDMRATGD